MSFTLSTDSILHIWDSALLSALLNSIALCILASFFAIGCGTILSGKGVLPRWVLCFLIGVYAINPVVRALSYFDLFHILTPMYVWSARLFGDRTSSTIILPAFVLGIHYLPIYLMRYLFILKKRNTLHDIPRFLELLFDDIPLWIRGFPISFALFFLLTFFDYWVIQLMSGNTALYWTPLFMQKAIQARAVSDAATMIVLGLIVTLLVYILASVLSRCTLLCWRFLRPLRCVQFSVQSSFFTGARLLLRYASIALLSWPLIWIALRVGKIVTQHSFVVMPHTTRAILTMVFLGISTAGISTILGWLLSVIFRQHPHRRRWWLQIGRAHV